MECDIVLEIGGKEDYIIKKEDSEKELSSLQDIVEYLNTRPKNELKLLIYNIQTSSTRIKNSQKYFLGKLLIGNCSFENLKIRYPKEMELLKGIDKPYIITLVDKAYSNGDMLKGRIVVNGITSYVLRNRFDVLNFAETEYKKYLAELIINDDNIIDEYLSEKYKDKLEIIRNNYKSNLERINLEGNSFDKFTIKHLIIDYLDNINEYAELIQYKDLVIDVGSVLNDFCRELNKQQIINEDSESDLARYLRRLNWKRELFGKAELYKGLSTYVPEFTLEISELLFMDLTESEMEELLLKCFKNDAILSDYHVVSVDKTTYLNIRLDRSQKKILFENVLKQKNEERKNLGEIELTGKYKDYITSLADALAFFEGYLNIEIEGKNYPVTISEDKGSIVYNYKGRKLTNDDKILLKKRSRTLKDEFNFGYNTKDIFTPVNENEVKDGYYKGFYIYNHVNLRGDNIFIISSSVISPDLFTYSKFKSLKDAKLAVEGYNRSANVDAQTKVELKQISSDTNGKRYVKLRFPTSTGQTINSIGYSLNPKIKLLANESELIKKTPSEILKFYKLLGIDISLLDLPEKIGTFIYAMILNEYSINNILNKTLQDIDYININKIINDIDDKSKSSIKQYLVEESFKNDDGTYTTYIKSLTDSGIIINSTGVDVEGNAPTLSLTSTLFNLKDTLEETLFKNTPIKIIVTDNDQLAELLDELGNKLFPDGTNHVKAFIYNNNIYINQSNTNLTSLIHETFHIVLGAIKAQDMINGTNVYKNILDFYDKKVSLETKNKVNDLYRNLAYLDRIEEGVVRYLANQINNDDIFYYSDRTNEAIELFREQFLNINLRIRKTIKSIDLNNDLGFASSLNTLISSQIDQIQQNRIASNLIEQGIEKGIILELCK